MSTYERSGKQAAAKKLREGDIEVLRFIEQAKDATKGILDFIKAMEAKYLKPKENKMQSMMFKKVLKKVFKAVDLETEDIRTGKALNARTRYMREDPKYSFTKFVDQSAQGVG